MVTSNVAMDTSLILRVDALVEQANSRQYNHSKSEHIAEMMHLLETLRQQVCRFARLRNSREHPRPRGWNM
jgi:hypothetical protein